MTTDEIENIKGEYFIMEDKIYILARFGGNWADEIDVDSYKVLEFNIKDYNYFLKCVEFCRNYQGEMGYSVGSNQWIEYENGADYLSAISLETISKEDYEVLKRLNMLGCGDDYFIDTIYDLYREEGAGRLMNKAEKGILIELINKVNELEERIKALEKKTKE